MTPPHPLSAPFSTPSAPASPVAGSVAGSTTSSVVESDAGFVAGPVAEAAAEADHVPAKPRVRQDAARVLDRMHHLPQVSRTHSCPSVGGPQPRADPSSPFLGSHRGLLSEDNFEDDLANPPNRKGSRSSSHKTNVKKIKRGHSSVRLDSSGRSSRLDSDLLSPLNVRSDTQVGRRQDPQLPGPSASPDTAIVCACS